MDRRLARMIAAAWLLLGAAPALAREWVDTSGSYRVEAEFIALRGAAVQLKKANGRVIEVPLARLNEESRQQALELGAATVIVTTHVSAESSDGAQDDGPAADVPSTTPDVAPNVALTEFFQGFVKHQPRIFWDALPAGYRRSANSLITGAAQKLDADTWNGAAKLARQAIEVLRTKREFVLNHPFVRQNTAFDPKLTDKQWDEVMALLSILTESDLAEHESALKLDLGKWLADDGAKFMLQCRVVSKLASTDAYNKFVEMIAATKIALVEVDGDQARVSLEFGGEQAINNLSRIEGKWLPADLTMFWTENIEPARAAIEQLSAEDLAAKKARRMLIIKNAKIMLDELAATKTQEEFNAQIDKMVARITALAEGAEPKK